MNNLSFFAVLVALLVIMASVYQVSQSNREIRQLKSGSTKILQLGLEYDDSTHQVYYNIVENTGFSYEGLSADDLEEEYGLHVDLCTEHFKITPITDSTVVEGQ